jgi:hypothetical protein
MTYYSRHDGSAGVFSGPATTFATETLLGLLRGRRPGFPHEAPPVGVFVPWAKKTGDIDWEDIRKPDHELIVYPLADAELRETANASGGHPVGWVGVLARSMALPAVVDTAFDGSAYELEAVDAVYLASDPKEVPSPFYLYLGKLREDERVRVSTSAVAERLGGRLVFPLPVSYSSPRPHPEFAFQQVERGRREAENVTAAAGLGRVLAVSGLGAVSAPPPPPPDDSGRARGLLAGAAVLGTAAWLFWNTVRPSPSRRRRS